MIRLILIILLTFSLSNNNIFIFCCFREGSIVADSAAVYSYPNNDSEIQFINNQLDTVLTTILTNTTNLETISQAFNTSNVTVDAITFEPPKISSKCLTRTHRVKRAHLMLYCANIYLGRFFHVFLLK